MIRTKTFLGRNVKTSLEWLDLNPEDLKFTDRPPASGAAPVHSHPNERIVSYYKCRR